MTEHTSGTAFIAAVVTGFVASLEPAWSYGLKLVSVLLLAVVAEVGRRAVGYIWNGGKPK